MKIQKKSYSAISPFMSFMLFMVEKKGFTSSEVNPATNSTKSRSCPARSACSRKRVGQRILNPRRVALPSRPSPLKHDAPLFLYNAQGTNDRLISRWTLRLPTGFA